MNSNNNSNNEAIEADSNTLADDGDSRGHMKKGPWTPQEDKILIEYVNKHGERNWNAVQKNFGLLRCGKSCRLRWANHLRPNLKKGSFSQEEEKIIVDLHAKIGNKWARMASQLPGRTDNEIKNFWNTRMKRRQREGLPLYPPEVYAEANAYHQLLRQQQHQSGKPYPSSSLSSFSLLLSSCYPKKLDEPSHYSTMKSHLDFSNYYTNPSQQFKHSNEKKDYENLTFPFSPLSPYGSSSSTLYNQSFAAHNATPTHDSYDCQYSRSYDHGFNTGSPYETLPNLVPGSTTEISLSQIAPNLATPASSNVSGVDGIIGASSITNDYNEVMSLSPQGNSGLLDALVEEAKYISRKDKSKSEDSIVPRKLCYKRKSMVSEENTKEEDSVLVASIVKNNGDIKENQKDEFIPSQLSTGKKPIGEDPLEEIKSMDDDDDLFSLLNNFPSEMPVPEWYRKGESQSLGLETQLDASSPSPTHQEFAWTLGTSWNNAPGIC